MKYMGSKRRLWKYIAPIVLRERKEGQLYVEPFCGGCNSLSQVEGRRFASDNNPYLIEMFKSVISGSTQIYPISREIYNAARTAYRKGDFSCYTVAELGWIGFMASYNGRFFDGGYSGNGVKSKDGGTRDYIDESIRDFLLSCEKLKGVEFHCCSYDELEIPDNSIVYLDPPYKNTKQYASAADFDYGKFYQWAENLAKKNKVFISEYDMPKSFRELWSMEVPCNINIEKNKRIERLFTI